MQRLRILDSVSIADGTRLPRMTGHVGPTPLHRAVVGLLLGVAVGAIALLSSPRRP